MFSPVILRYSFNKLNKTLAQKGTLINNRVSVFSLYVGNITHKEITISPKRLLWEKDHWCPLTVTSSHLLSLSTEVLLWRF